jgi:hypothetical protein
MTSILCIELDQRSMTTIAHVDDVFWISKMHFVGFWQLLILQHFFLQVHWILVNRGEYFANETEVCCDFDKLSFGIFGLRSFWPGA